MSSEMDNAVSLPADYVLNDRYTIGKVIGVGGFGIVYIAWDNNLDIKVAVKEFLPKEYAARSSNHVSIIPYTGSAHEDLSLGVEKFLEEAKALARFQDHPGIVTVHESFRANNTAYMVMQYLDGMTLKEYLKSKPSEKIAFTKAVEVMTPIMDALREVHNAGFVHRDISPDNIFLTYQKQVKLLDFGSARYAIGKHSKSLTTVLKNGYAPPEQYSAKVRQGPWSDVYAVCATIYRCVTGFEPPDAMDRIQVDTIKSPRQLGIDIPLSGEGALMRGLALKASDRFENIQQLQQALTEIPVIIECPKCGAKNQLPPGNDPNAMRCWRCKTKLGRTKGFRSPDDTPWISLSLFVLVSIIIVIMVGIFLELPPQPSPPTGMTAPAPESAEYWSNKAYTLCSSGKCTDPQKAIEYLNEAIRLKPDFATAYNNRGYAYIRSGNNLEACSSLSRACELGNCKGYEWAKQKDLCENKSAPAPTPAPAPAPIIHPFHSKKN